MPSADRVEEDVERTGRHTHRPDPQDRLAERLDARRDEDAVSAAHPADHRRGRDAAGRAEAGGGVRRDGRVAASGRPGRPGKPCRRSGGGAPGGQCPPPGSGWFPRGAPGPGGSASRPAGSVGRPRGRCRPARPVPSAASSARDRRRTSWRGGSSAPWPRTRGGRPRPPRGRVAWPGTSESRSC